MKHIKTFENFTGNGVSNTPEKGINENTKIDNLEKLIGDYELAQKKYYSARVDDKYSMEEVHKLSKSALELKDKLLRFNTFIDKKGLTDEEIKKLEGFIDYIDKLESKTPRNWRGVD